jgi:hypothetical protein
MGHQRAALVLFLGSFMSFCGSPAVAGTDSVFSVQLAVSGDPLITTDLQSCLNREIRNLGDVRLVDSDASYSLSVVGLATQFDGRTVGYTASALILDHTGAHRLAAAQAKGVTTAAEVLDRMKAGTLALVPNIKQLGRNVSHVLMQYRDLPRLCQNIVATLDTETLEPARRAVANQPVTAP